MSVSVFVGSAHAQSRPPPGSEYWKLTKGGPSGAPSPAPSGATTARPVAASAEDEGSVDETPVGGYSYVFWRTADPLKALEGRTCFARTRVPIEPTCGVADCLEDGEPMLDWSIPFSAKAKVETNVCRSHWKAITVELNKNELVIGGARRAPGAPEDEPLREVIFGAKVYTNGTDVAIAGNVVGSARCSPFDRRKTRILLVCPAKVSFDGRPSATLEKWITIADAGGGRARTNLVGGHAAVALAKLLRRPSKEVLVLAEALESKRPGIELFFADAGLQNQVDQIAGSIQQSLSGEVVRRRLFDKLGGEEMLLSVGSASAR